MALRDRDARQVQALMQSLDGAHAVGAIGRRTFAQLMTAGVVGLELVAGEARSRQGRRRGRATRQIPLRLGEAKRGALHLWLEGEDLQPMFVEMIGAVVAAALGRQVVLQRVAAVSRRALEQNRSLRFDLAARQVRTPVCSSRSMRAALERAERVAGYRTTVLIDGEPGVGKEVLARYVHSRSPRAHRPFLAVNCGALPEQLVESELFGHESGAFTGAQRRHAGFFERAHKGTLFLDEVGELPLAAQVKLLRVIQESVFTRVGSEVEEEVDVRLIAATNRSLAQMVAQGDFREDLFYRINVFPIRVPALRERPDDLPILVNELLEEISREMGKEAPRISPAVLSRLAARSWPGNVRELRNTLEAAMIMSTGDTLVLPNPSGPSVPATPHPRSVGSLESTIRGSIAAALEASGGKIYGAGGAAERLEIHPATLQSKMKKLGIRRSDFVTPEGRRR